MHALLAEGIRTGEVAPLPWTVFARGKMQDAFRYLASGALHGPACTCKTLQRHARELEANNALPSSYALLLDGTDFVAKDCTWPCAASSSHFNHVPLCLHAACPIYRPATELPRHAMVKRSHKTVYSHAQACTWARC